MVDLDEAIARMPIDNYPPIERLKKANKAMAKATKAMQEFPGGTEQKKAQALERLVERVDKDMAQPKKSMKEKIGNGLKWWANV